jgi:hypothetical protein
MNLFVYGPDKEKVDRPEEPNDADIPSNTAHIVSKTGCGLIKWNIWLHATTIYGADSAT